MVKKLDAESYDQHKQRRDEHKSMIFSFFFLTRWLLICWIEATRYTNPIKSKFRLKRMAAESMSFFPRDSLYTY